MRAQLQWPSDASDRFIIPNLWGGGLLLTHVSEVHILGDIELVPNFATSLDGTTVAAPDAIDRFLIPNVCVYPCL